MLGLEAWVLLLPSFWYKHAQSRATRLSVTIRAWPTSTAVSARTAAVILQHTLHAYASSPIFLPAECTTLLLPSFW